MKSKLVYAAIAILCVLSVLLVGVLSVYRTEDKSFTKEVQRYIEEIVQAFPQK